MTWNDVGKTLSTAAPLLATVLGGPAGAAASAAASLAASALGVAATPEALAEAVTDPDKLVELKKLEVEERARLLDWLARQTEAELADLRDARARETALALAGRAAAWTTPVLSLAVVGGFFWMLRMALTPEMDTGAGQPALLLLGALGSAFGAVVNYYLGSSIGSQRKTEMLAGFPGGPK